MGDSGDPMAAPSSCSKNPSSTWKWVERKQNSTCSQMTSGGMLVRSMSDSSLCRRDEMTWSASSIGTLVNRLTTSKLTILSGHSFQDSVSRDPGRNAKNS